MDDDVSPERFGDGWDRDWFAVDPDEIQRRFETEWRRDLLLTDYEQAGEDGRNRDNLLHNSYYVSLVLLGLLLNVGLSLHRNQEYVVLAGVAAVGAVLYVLLFLWSKNSRAARDASWDRRSEIEDMVKVVDLHALRSNDSSFKRLSRVDDGTYRVEGKSRLENRSIGWLIMTSNFVTGIGFVALAFVSAYLALYP